MTLGTLASTTHRITALGGAQLDRRLDRLASLFTDAAASGAVDGLTAPPDAAAVDYWLRVRAAVARGTRILLADDDARGTVQITLDGMPRGRHRALVTQLFVRRDARRDGLGTALVEAAEQAARRAGRTVVVVETRPNADAERLLARLRYAPQGTAAGTASFYRELT